ncbi:hypothetical protein STRTUCAR8_01332 [Streptomyces turgidiscabies Car8]|uniref:Uncharacterized protein n=1 Tax=Streptomyces turgidiscabies (strain Car8) TaxID=698760 RepID=L7F659_STRT8|nr:hypothetical protein STRTUCAR8_01332 [Streptomyces turgidiscabies Car8]
MLGFCVITPLVILLCGGISQWLDDNGFNDEKHADAEAEKKLRWARDYAVEDIVKSEERVRSQLADLERETKAKIDRIMGE